MKISIACSKQAPACLSLTIFFYFMQIALFAQQGTASITGKVNANTGEVLSGVTISATNDATQETISTTTDESGNFTLRLRVGSAYSFTATYVGYAQSERRGVKVQPGTNS